METFKLTLLFKILGIGAASGLWYQNNELFLIADNSTYLYQYSITAQKLYKIPLVTQPEENIPKQHKPDLEVITAEKGQLVLLGSGSTGQRCRSFTYKMTSGRVTEKNLSYLFEIIQQQTTIPAEEFNIEGLIFDKNQMYLFQRGNGIAAKNGIIKINDDIAHPNAVYYPIVLPKINGVTASFTDAVLVDGIIYFLAAAESSNSTYHDGEIAGSMLGTINLATLTLQNTHVISKTHKFEGLTMYKKSNTTIEFLLCEDQDSEARESNIYHLELHL